MGYIEFMMGVKLLKLKELFTIKKSVIKISVIRIYSF